MRSFPETDIDPKFLSDKSANKPIQKVFKTSGTKLLGTGNRFLPCKLKFGIDIFVA